MPMNLSSIEEAVSLAEARWPGYDFRIVGNEAHGPCPICGKATEDGFILYPEGNYFCRPGGCTGWIDEDQKVRLTSEERAIRKLQAEQKRQAREIANNKRRLSALERMARCTDHVTYHKMLDDNDRKWWHTQGIGDEQIEEYQLGVCYNCPTDKDHRPSYTIPVYDSKWSRLLNIRHRLIGTTNGDKYRPHVAGLPSLLFNSRFVLTEPEIVIAEGSKKSIVVSAAGIPTVGIFGCNGFNLAWTAHFAKTERIFICLDPGVEDVATALGDELAKRLACEIRICACPVKPDDFITHYNKTADDFRQMMSWAKLVRRGQ